MIFVIKDDSTVELRLVRIDRTVGTGPSSPAGSRPASASWSMGSCGSTWNARDHCAAEADNQRQSPLRSRALTCPFRLSAFSAPS